jgi:hypothetical protein
MVVSLEPVVRHNYVHLLPTPDAATLVGNFWSALAQLMPEAFSEPKEFTVMKSPGVYAWHLVLPSIIEHLRDQQDFSVEAHASVLRPTGEWVEAETWHTNRGHALTLGTGLKTLRMLAAQISEKLPELRLPAET